uniref:Uncharacterized protein n=1 Tax=Panagrolaimus sp. ES5 TaxID=591445 RepID=A0AC34F5D9_9BILA
MKTDKTPPASTSEITASARPFSNRHHPKSTETKPLLPLNQTKKKVEEKEASLKSFKEDETAASESTAKRESVTTPKQIFISPAPISTSNVKTKTPLLNNESFISPTTKEEDGFSTPIKRKNDKKQAYFSKSRCFGFFEYGRVFFEIFKSSIPTTSSDECSVDRIEIYTLIGKEMQEVLLNRIVSSTAFFFQCPECALESRLHPSSNFFKLKKDNQKKLRYTIGMINESIPFNARTCVGSLSTNCDLDKSRLVKNTGNSFSYRVIKHKIVEDKGFCSA